MTEDFKETLGADAVIPVSGSAEALNLYRRRQQAIREGKDPDEMVEPDVVWFNTIDDGAFAVLVKRKVDEESDHHATLTVVRSSDSKLLLEEDVYLSYGAVFGPDVDDLALWQDKALAAVDMNEKDIE